MKITTNNVPRFLIDDHELTPAERERFDYLDWSAIDAGRDSASFVRYKGHLYCLDEFTRLDGGELQRAGWHGASADSFFSGVLIRLCDDGESAVMAWYCE